MHGIVSKEGNKKSKIYFKLVLLKQEQTTGYYHLGSNENTKVKKICN